MPLRHFFIVFESKTELHPCFVPFLTLFHGATNQQKLNSSSSSAILPTFPNSTESSTTQQQAILQQTPSPATSSSRQNSSQSTCKCPYHQQVQHPDFHIFSQQSLALKNNGNADQRELYSTLKKFKNAYKTPQKKALRTLLKTLLKTTVKTPLKRL